jgi:hypothetical protein
MRMLKRCPEFEEIGLMIDLMDLILRHDDLFPGLV